MELHTSDSYWTEVVPVDQSIYHIMWIYGFTLLSVFWEPTLSLLTITYSCYNYKTTQESENWA